MKSSVNISNLVLRAAERRNALAMSRTLIDQLAGFLPSSSSLSSSLSSSSSSSSSATFLFDLQRTTSIARELITSTTPAPRSSSSSSSQCWFDSFEDAELQELYCNCQIAAAWAERLGLEQDWNHSLCSEAVLARFCDEHQSFILRGLRGEQNVEWRCVRDLFLHPKLHAAFSELTSCVIEALRVCNCRSFATGGTLLGAVRHSGKFIPWDDDVDLVCAPCSTSKEQDEFVFDASLRNALFSHANEMFFAEPTFFGYKCHARPVLYQRHLSSLGEDPAVLRKMAPFGIFVDIFVLRSAPDSPELELAFPSARKTWPKERWVPEMTFPLQCAAAGEQSSRNECSLPKNLMLPHQPLDYLFRVFGSDCLKQGVIPRTAHGKCVGTTDIEFDLYEKAAG